MELEALALIDACSGGDDDVDYVARELIVGLGAFQSAERALQADDAFGAWVFCRTLAETTIRLSWVGSRQVEAGSHVRHRMERLFKRDLLNLAAADDAVRSVAEQEIVGNRPMLDAALEANLHEPAPRSMREMASQAGWEWVYGIHRLASTIIHPGLVAWGGFKTIEASDVAATVEWTFAATVLGAAAVLTELSPDLTFPPPRTCAEVLKNPAV